MIEKLKEINSKVEVATKEIRLFPILASFLIYLLAYFIMDYLMLFLILPDSSSAIYYLGRVSYASVFVLAAFTFMLGKKSSVIFFGITSTCFLLYGFGQACYSSVNNTLFRLKTISMLKEAIGYAGTVIASLPKAYFVLFAVILLVIVAVIVINLKLYVPLREKAKKVKIIMLSTIIVICVLWTVIVSPTS